jgi:nucleotide-binding universal stress UspA family protein
MKTIVLCVDVNQECLDTLKTLPSKFDLRNAQVHLLHVFENQVYNADLAPWVIPMPEQKPEIEKSINETLMKLALDLDLNSESIQVKCVFAFSREHEVKEYLTQVKADVVVLATRGKHGVIGLFTSSLADFLCKYSPCDVFVLRPRKIM